MYYPLGVTHGNQTVIEERTEIVKGAFGDVLVPGSWVGLFFLGFVIITSVAFKKQRSFPSVIVIWMTAVDMFHFLRSLFQGSPIPEVCELFFWDHTEWSCWVEYLQTAWTESAQCILMIYLSLVVYLVVVKKVDLSKKWYYHAMVGGFWAYTTAYTCVVAIIMREGWQANGHQVCVPKRSVTILAIAQTFVAIMVSGVFVIISFKYIWAIVKSLGGGGGTRKFGNPNGKIYFIVFRFMTTILLQTAVRAIMNAYFILLEMWNDSCDRDPVGCIPEYDRVRKVGLVAVWIIVLGYFINAFIILISNKSLIRWLDKKYEYYSILMTNYLYSQDMPLPSESDGEDSSSSELSTVNTTISSGTHLVGISDFL